jgi:hypothetical protein
VNNYGKLYILITQEFTGMSMLDPNEIIEMKATPLTMSQAVNALNDYYAA